MRMVRVLPGRGISGETFFCLYFQWFASRGTHLANETKKNEKNKAERKALGASKIGPGGVNHGVSVRTIKLQVALRLLVSKWRATPRSGTVNVSSRIRANSAGSAIIARFVPVDSDRLRL